MAVVITAGQDRAARQFLAGLEGDATSPAAPASDSPGGRVDGLTIRRWEAAETDRLNEAHWQNATGAPVNEDLVSDLSTLRARACYEAYNNPIVEGVIRTYGIDLIGESGPTLQVESEDPAYNQALREVWDDWWDSPTVDGVLSGIDWLHQCNWGCWTKGPILAQLVADPSADYGDPVHTRLLPLDPDRLATPASDAGASDVMLGVRRDRNGRPMQYNLVEYEDAFGAYRIPKQQSNWIAAENVLHAFESLEPGQATGFPWLSSSLQEIADLRDFDVQVLDAQRAAAETGVYFEATGPEATENFRAVSGEATLKRRTHRFLPPGYHATQLTPGQPSAQYISYRHEKLRAIGRPAHMPLLLILLSAEESNFSQSRIDVNVFYERGLRFRRRWLARQVLDRLVRLVEREATLATRGGRFILPRRPRRVRFTWGWDPMPQADPTKTATAIATALEYGWITYEDVLAQYGKTLETTIRVRAEINKKLEAAGLPKIPGPSKSEATPAEDDGGEPTATVQRRDGAKRAKERSDAQHAKA